MISSRLNRLVYAASGFSVECAWFFSAIFANSSKLVPPYLWPYSMPTWANTPGMVSVPTLPSSEVTSPKRPSGSQDAPSALAVLPVSRPTPASFSAPTARPISASPALIAMTATRSAVAPVAQALVTLNAGMPVCPICFCSRCARPPEPSTLPAAITCMSLMPTPASPSAPSAASDARSTMSSAGRFPNLVM